MYWSCSPEIVALELNQRKIKAIATKSLMKAILIQNSTP